MRVTIILTRLGADDSDCCPGSGESMLGDGDCFLYDDGGKKVEEDVGDGKESSPESSPSLGGTINALTSESMSESK